MAFGFNRILNRKQARVQIAKQMKEDAGVSNKVQPYYSSRSTTPKFSNKERGAILRSFKQSEVNRENRRKLNKYAYQKSRSGRFAKAFSRGISVVAPRRGSVIGAITTQAYGESLIKPQTVKGRNTGRRGRPFGTYDKRYSAYGGVYNYRKIMNQQGRLEIIKARQNAQLSPSEQAYLNDIRRRSGLAAVNPEAQATPDTNGQVSSGSFDDEINNAANLVD